MMKLEKGDPSSFEVLKKWVLFNYVIWCEHRQAEQVFLKLEASGSSKMNRICSSMSFYESEVTSSDTYNKMMSDSGLSWHKGH